MANYSGVLGSFDLSSQINQAIYVNNDSSVSAVTLSVCNRGGVTSDISVAISASATTPTSREWIRFNVPLTPKNTLELNGLMINPGQYVVVKSSEENVNAVVYGVRGGDVIESLAITENLGTAPVWETGTTLTFVAADSTPQQLSTVDTSSVTYALTSGTLPTGLSLSSTGLITGTAPTTGYAPAGPDEETSVTITATDGNGLETPRTFNIVRTWKDGTSSGTAIPATTSVTAVTDYTSQTSGDIWVQDRSGNAVQTKLYKTGGIAYVLIAGISDNTTHGQYTVPSGPGQWMGKWSSTETFGSYTTANQQGGYKNSLYHDYTYGDILVMQGFTNGSIASDYYTNSNEVAYTNNNWLLSPYGGNLKNFFSGQMGPDLRLYGNGGRTKIPVTFLKGSAATSRSRYKNGSTQGEMSATNVLDFGNQNGEGYRFAMCNALGCEATGGNIEHQSWVADIMNNYSGSNYPEPNWDANWGITGVSWLYWLFWAKS